MINDKAQQLFNEQFRFSLNQEVRHKGDSKNGFSSDMGLLILQRVLMENSDDDGNVHFTRNYICRLIRFSGSGDMGQFKESELMTMDEYTRRGVEQERHREEVRNEMYATQEEIFTSFGVKRGTKVYIKDHNGNFDKENIYKVSGYSMDKEETLLTLRKAAGEGKTLDEFKAKSKSDFQIIEKED